MNEIVEIMNNSEKKINYLTEELQKKNLEIDNLRKQIKTT